MLSTCTHSPWWMQSTRTANIYNKKILKAEFDAYKKVKVLTVFLRALYQAEAACSITCFVEGFLFAYLFLIRDGCWILSKAFSTFFKTRDFCSVKVKFSCQCVRNVSFRQNIVLWGSPHLCVPVSSGSPDRCQFLKAVFHIPRFLHFLFALSPFLNSCEYWNYILCI